MNDERMIERARAALDDGIDGLDGATRSRLTQARAAAVARVGHRRSRRWLMAPALAAALTAAVTLNVLDRWPAPDVTPTPEAGAAVAMADLDILTAEEDLELLADLEFYLWLEAEMPATEAG